MRILIPILGFGRAGGYRVLSRLADGLIDDGCHVAFVVNRYMAEPYFPTRAEIRPVDLFGKPASPTKEIPKAFNGLTNMWALYRAIRDMEHSFDGIIANHSLTVHPSVFGTSSRKKVVYYIQAYEPEYYKGSGGVKGAIYAAISRRSYRQGIAQIVNSPVYLSYREIEAGRCVPPGFDPSHFYPAPEEVQPKGHITLGCIGRSEPYKGTGLVLDAFERIYRQDNRYRLKVAYGNLPPGWTHPAAEVVKPSNDAELGDFYRSIDIYIGAGTVQQGAYHYPVMEALACGTPVVHTGYSPGSVENSWIVPQGECDAIIASVLQFDWGTANVKRARGLDDVSELSWPRVTSKFNRYVREILAA